MRTYTHIHVFNIHIKNNKNAKEKKCTRLQIDKIRNFQSRYKQSSHSHVHTHTIFIKHN
jgi:hypothetical protein